MARCLTSRRISVSTSDVGGDDARAHAGSANARSGGCSMKADGESQRGVVERRDGAERRGGHGWVMMMGRACKQDDGITRCDGLTIMR
jgi:hypothetical protein